MTNYSVTAFNLLFDQKKSSALTCEGFQVLKLGFYKGIIHIWFLCKFLCNFCAVSKYYQHKPCSWSGRQDLNLRPLHPQCSALPGCATPRFKCRNDTAKGSFCNQKSLPKSVIVDSVTATSIRLLVQCLSDQEAACTSWSLFCRVYHRAFGEHRQ